jgi:hypothetical protein
MTGSKNLILGTWTTLLFQGLERFIASLCRKSFEGDVCIFVDAVPPATVKELMAHGVIVERATHYEMVMIADLRAVLFQADPFAMPWLADLVFAQERRRVGDCTINQGWIAQAYGEAMADNLRYGMISCSGTTFGTVHAMQRYLELMIKKLSYDSAFGYPGDHPSERGRSVFRAFSVVPYYRQPSGRPGRRHRPRHRGGPFIRSPLMDMLRASLRL